MKPGAEPVYMRLLYMGRKYRLQNRRKQGFMDTVPLVDAVLLIFIFFVTQASFVLQPGIRVDLPTSSFDHGAAYGSLVVTVSQEGMVFFNDERTPLDGLGPAFARAVHEQPDCELLIEADDRVRYASLVQIFNMAREAGIRDVTLANRLGRPSIPPAP